MKISSRSFFTIGLTAALLFCGTAPSPAVPPQSEEDALSVAPELKNHAALSERRVSVRNGVKHISAGRNEISFPATGTGFVELKSDTARIKIGLPAASASPGMQGSIGITYSHGKDATTVIPKTDGSVQIATTISGPGSPTEFAYPVELPSAAKLEVTDGGFVVATDQTGGFLGGFSAPWAKDSAGKVIPTRYEVHGMRLIQRVEHRRAGVAYPVVSDPWLGVDLYHQPWWNSKNGGWTVNVTPTAWGVSFSNATTWWAHRDEVRSKMGNDSWRWTTSIKQQFYCHIAGLPLSLPEYNLESWRPAWNWWEMAPYNCNYPERGWGSIWR